MFYTMEVACTELLSAYDSFNQKLAADSNLTGKFFHYTLRDISPNLAKIVFSTNKEIISHIDIYTCVATGKKCATFHFNF